jgi:hypothetical protein
MGSIITLGINKMEIDWGKNNVFSNHSSLFQKGDFEQKIPYYTVDDEDEVIIQYENGAKKKLKDIKERLDLLGYDLKGIEEKYNEIVDEYEFYTENKMTMSFENFKKFLINIDTKKVDNIRSAIEDIEDGYESGEFFRKCILGDEEISDNIFSEFEEGKYIIGEFFESIDPYIILRILAENESNLESYVEWRYNEVIENRWVKKEDIIEELGEKNKILIATEGSTDSFILKRTIDILYPNISDFFNFIDMKENYPFTGVGSLKNFCNGLAKINIQNNIIVLFDNDTAGIETFNAIRNIQKPINLLFCHLPDYREFETFKTIGPFGNQINNINGKAVSIECFLDLSSVENEPIVRWKNYNERMQEYQGALENKDRYTIKFKSANLLDGSYDCSKLKHLIDYIIKEWMNRK